MSNEQIRQVLKSHPLRRQLQHTQMPIRFKAMVLGLTTLKELNTRKD